MDKNKRNYDVDNILDEIKQRKAREKAGADTPARQADSGRERPTRGAVQPASAPRRADPGQDGPLRTPDRLGESEEGGFRFSSPTEDVPTSGEGEFRFAPPEADTPPVQARGKTQKSRPVLSGAPQADADGFEFVMPPVERVSRNPMEFDGDVQSIADRARRHPNRFVSRIARQERQSVPPPPPQPERQTFDFVPVSPPADEEPLPPPALSRREDAMDLSLFRPPVEDDPAYQGSTYKSPAAKDATGERTRILPKFDFSQELQMEDIQKLDFGGDQGIIDDEKPEEPEDIDFSQVTDVPPADFSEYNSTKDRAAVSRDIARVKLWLRIRTVFTLALTVGLFYLTLSGRYPLPLPALIIPETSLRMFLAAFVAFGVLLAVVCSSTVGGGLLSLFKLRANSDTMAALALLAAIAQSVAAMLSPDRVDIAAMSLYLCVAGLALLFNCLGKLVMINRIQSNFRVVAGTAPKRAVLPVESDTLCAAFLPPEGRRRPTVAFSVKTGFFTDFLALSYSDKYDAGVHRGVAPICLLGAILVSVLAYALTSSIATAFAALTAILCVAATLSATFVENIPLSKLCRKITPKGGIVSGNKAVEDFCDTKAILLREGDLFPEGHVQLHGIKAYSHGRIDEAILDAASVLCAMDSALSPVFLQVIGGNKKLLKPVDSIVYEDGKGISAWVDSRRVLIGNRALMQSHGVPLPDESYREKFAQQDGEVLFLSNSGDLSAQFVVSYHVDEELALELDHMATRGIRLIVYAVDPNITAHKLWSLYGFPQELIQVMPAPTHGEYHQMAAPRDNAIAEILYTGRASVMLQAIRACMGARSSILTATVIQLVQVALGYGTIALAAFMGAIGELSVLHLTAYQLFWFLAILLVQQIKPD